MARRSARLSGAKRIYALTYPASASGSIAAVSRQGEEDCAKERMIYLNDACRDALSVVKSVNHPRVGILCDYYHMSLSGETASDVPDFAEYITHLHIASPSNSRTMPFAYDSDKDNYDAFFASLKACGYKHEYLSVEGHLPGGVDEQKAFSDCFEYLNSKTGAF